MFLQRRSQSSRKRRCQCQCLDICLNLMTRNKMSMSMSRHLPRSNDQDVNVMSRHLPRIRGHIDIDICLNLMNILARAKVSIPGRVSLPKPLLPPRTHASTAVPCSYHHTAPHHMLTLPLLELWQADLLHLDAKCRMLMA